MKLPNPSEMIRQAMLNEKNPVEEIIAVKKFMEESEMPLIDITMAAIALQALAMGFTPKQVVEGHLEAAPGEIDWIPEDKRQEIEEA